MRRTFQQIAQLTVDMQNAQSINVRRMKEIIDRYNGDWVIPIPSMATEPVLPPLTPFLIGEAIDSQARAACSVRPTVFSPALEPSKDRGKRSKAYATTRRKIIAATYHHSRWDLGRRRFYRQLAAYHTGSICVVPDFDRGMPSIEVRDPLGTFPEMQAHEQLRDPEYVAFVTRHSGSYLRKTYPKVQSERGGPITPVNTGMMWDIVEWYDMDQFVGGLIGPVNPGIHVADYQTVINGAPWMQISESYDNKTGCLPAVIPHSVALAGIASRIGALIGNVDLQAKLMSLDILAQEKAIFPDMYAIGRSNGMPGVIGGKWKDGREGEVNFLQDIESVGLLHSTPDQRTQQMIDRLERGFRVSTGLAGNLTGENTSNLRTGRAIDTLAGLSLDPRIQELHEITQAYLPNMNKAILGVWKGYFDTPQKVWSGWPGDLGLVEFTPSEHIETTENAVTYAIAGADVVQQTQILGSLFGAQAISKHTFRVKHPLIDDPEGEERLIGEEGFDEALRMSIVQKLTNGEVPTLVAVKIRNRMAVDGMDIFDAVEATDAEMRELQAQQPPPPPPGMAAAPALMPGVDAGPGGMAPQVPAEGPQQVQGGFSDVGRFKELLTQMGGHG